MSEPRKKSGGCTAGCCSAPTPAPAPDPVLHPAQEKVDSCTSGCCGGGNSANDIVTPVAEEDDCCKPSTSRNEENLNSVANEAAAVAEDVGCQSDDDCCKPAAKSVESLGCQDACCKADDELSVKDSCCESENLKVAPGCSDGCCGQEDAVEVVEDTCCKPATPSSVPACSDGCCAPKGQPAIEDSCCKEEDAVVDTGCQDSCCGGDDDEDIKDDCCDQPVDLPQEDTCNDGCCSGTKASEIEPACCEGKKSPCCDVTCIDRLVFRETSNEKQGDDTTSSIDKGTKSSKAKSIRERYETRLSALGCLCRALIALGQESCCATSELSSEERKRGPKKNTRSRSQKKKPTSPCEKEISDGCCSKPLERKPSISSTRSKSCKKGCCGGPKAKEKRSVVTSKEIDCCSQDPGSKGDCCQKDETVSIRDLPKKDGGMGIEITNLEKGLSGSERVVLGITGMTCTGCETKLQRTLGDVRAINNLKTSLVMARVQFQLDLSLATPEDVMKHIERTTEFKCDRIATHGLTIDIVPAEGAKQFLQQSLPLGVDIMDQIDEHTVRVNFDPEVVGARDLINRGFEIPPTLAPPQADPSLAAGSKHVRHMGWMTLLSAILTIPVLVLAWAPLEERPVTYGAVSLALATIVQVLIAGPFYPKALKSLVFSRVVEMDLLIVLSTTAAYVFSVISFGYLANGNALSTGNFFETSTLLVTLIMVGRWVSALARQKAVESISIRTLQASTAILIAKDGSETEIDTRLLQYGDSFKVVPHSQVPTDGVVLSGVTEVDESMLTGESRPVEKKPGSTIIAGSLNGPSTVTARLTKLPGENTISTIAGMVDDAKLSKPKIQDLADRVASFFVPAVISLTIIVFVVWVGVGIRSQGKSGSEAVTQAITYAITVLIVSCPCAIGLAVPMVIVIACGVAAEKGVIFKASEAVEVAHNTTHVVFDKTGTLTNGKLCVATEEYVNTHESQDFLASKILGLLADVNHPVSSAVASHLKAQNVQPTHVQTIQSLPGKGVQGTIDGALIQAGNPRWLGFEAHALVSSVTSNGSSAFCVAIGSELQAVFTLTDTTRPETQRTIAALQKRSIGISILSGDDAAAVQSLAAELGIPAENAVARCSPADKAAYIRNLLNTPLSTNGNVNGKGKDKNEPVVIFIGDGTNDAVALAQATIGVHVNSGTSDVAQAAADVVLMRPDLDGLLTMIDVSRAAVRRVAFNFGWSAVYNLFAVLLAAGAFTAAGRNGEGVVRIPPEYAGLGEVVSVLPVIVVAVTLRWARI
ncbi:hypothetical protein M426DRAFT_319772 [Hypoxylon sp. CI-4A]|nr:hypothetical protein M426DRAFT_319772 [Hypoxylon sp. CI-4A]